MAQGWLNHLKGNQYTAFSAGIETHGLNPHAVQVMAEAGVDISSHRSQLLEDFANQHFDLVITVCDHASEHCPIFPGNTRKTHKGFSDPPKLAKDLKGEAALDCYRKVRDEIRVFIETLSLSQ